MADGRMMSYRGNTSCVEVTLADGTEIILDAGTGIRALSEARPGELRSAQILLTHLHLDHIQGLLFFAPLFASRGRVDIYGPRAQWVTTSRSDLLAISRNRSHLSRSASCQRRCHSWRAPIMNGSSDRRGSGPQPSIIGESHWATGSPKATLS